MVIENRSVVGCKCLGMDSHFVPIGRLASPMLRFIARLAVNLITVASSLFQVEEKPYRQKVDYLHEA